MTDANITIGLANITIGSANMNNAASNNVKYSFNRDEIRQIQTPIDLTELIRHVKEKEKKEQMDRLKEAIAYTFDPNDKEKKLSAFKTMEEIMLPFLDQLPITKQTLGYSNLYYDFLEEVARKSTVEYFQYAYTLKLTYIIVRIENFTTQDYIEYLSKHTERLTPFDDIKWLGYELLADILKVLSFSQYKLTKEIYNEEHRRYGFTDWLRYALYTYSVAIKQIDATHETQQLANDRFATNQELRQVRDLLNQQNQELNQQNQELNQQNQVLTQQNQVLTQRLTKIQQALGMFINISTDSI